ncbi:MAG: hypothetical protein IJJ44_06715 [Solobacterium sp.]|nr:hypothetical protein [Solobacterium sp.]
MKVIQEGAGDTLVVLIGEEDIHPYVQEFPGVCFLGIYDFDWNRCMSPWPAERIFRKGEDFAGQADEFLKELDTVLQEYPQTRKILVGYSLAGLFVLYASTIRDDLYGVGSVSGSLWYKELDTYMKTHPCKAVRVYLSLGDLEKKTRNPLMSKVEEKTAEIAELLHPEHEVIFELNEGNHFKDAGQRITKAIRWLLR